MPEINESLIEELLQNGNLVLRHDIKWKSEHLHYKFEKPIDNNVNGVSYRLDVIGTKNKITRDYSYCLLLERKKRIRAFDPFKPHKNNSPEDNRYIRGLHKHKWSDNYEDRQAYVPDDITDPEDMRLSFTQFLNECNIRFLGNYTDPPPTQFPLPM